MDQQPSILYGRANCKNHAGILRILFVPGSSGKAIDYRVIGQEGNFGFRKEDFEQWLQSQQYEDQED